jgi:hypothetical protein
MKSPASWTPISLEQWLSLERERRARLFPRGARCTACHENDLLVLVPDDRCVLCADCDAIRRGCNPMEKHHLAGRRNGPWCLFVPANMHRRLTAIQRYRWKYGHG